jgi:hypothetical protein
MFASAMKKLEAFHRHIFIESGVGTDPNNSYYINLGIGDIILIEIIFSQVENPDTRSTRHRMHLGKYQRASKNMISVTWAWIDRHYKEIKNKSSAPATPFNVYRRF